MIVRICYWAKIMFLHWSISRSGLALACPVNISLRFALRFICAGFFLFSKCIISWSKFTLSCLTKKYLFHSNHNLARMNCVASQFHQLHICQFHDEFQICMSRQQIVEICIGNYLCRVLHYFDIHSILAQVHGFYFDKQFLVEYQIRNNHNLDHMIRVDLHVQIDKEHFKSDNSSILIQNLHVLKDVLISIMLGFLQLIENVIKKVIENEIENMKSAIL